MAVALHCVAPEIEMLVSPADTNERVFVPVEMAASNAHPVK
jgi:hypothetical protein